MNRSKLSLLVLGIVASAVLAAGCETANNTNRNVNANLNVNANANAPAPRNENANVSGGGGGISRDEFERTKDRVAQQAKELGRKIGSGADDLWIWTKTRAALAAAEDLRDSTINVDVDNNVVTLGGTVPTEAQKSKAESVARGIEGVKNVRNNLRVSPEAATRNRNAR